MALYDVQFDLIQNLKPLDGEGLHSEVEFELYAQKGELGSQTRLGNLFIKKTILDKLNLPLKNFGSQVVVERQMLQAYGFGRPLVRLSAELSQKWGALFQGLPSVSLSHDENRVALVLYTEKENQFKVGVDILNLNQASRLYESGNYTMYVTPEERRLFDNIEESSKKIELLLGGFCIKEALFKAIGSSNLLGAHNRMCFMQVWPQKNIEGSWNVEILQNDEPLQVRGTWYPRLYEIFKDEMLDVNHIEASYQKVDAEYGLAVVKCFL